jgi:hypothetical protein
MIIFLDIDGVIATKKSYNSEKDYMLDRKCIAVLNKLIEKTGAKIVISSGWRNTYSAEQLKEIFEFIEIKAEVIGVTPELRSGKRGQEILKWLLANNRQNEDYIVIDDYITDIKNYIPKSRIIHVKDGFENEGLTERHIERFLLERRV